jgi:hypothetical protein
MAHRQLLTDEERRALLGMPTDADGMARRFTLSRADQELMAARRRDSNRIGFRAISCGTAPPPQQGADAH